MVVTKRTVGAILLAWLLVACAAPLEIQDVSFRDPASCPGSVSIDDMVVAAIPIDELHDSERIFNTDTKKAGILPVQIVIRNSGNKEFEIDHRQIFGVTGDGTYYVAYDIDKAAGEVRASSIGTSMAQRAAVGAIAGAAGGAALGAAIGGAAGDAGQGAASGAAIGGAVGVTSGAVSGATNDRITLEFKKQMAKHAFENRVIYPGDLQQGFVYLSWHDYHKLRFKIFNISDNETTELEIPVSVCIR